MYIHIYLYLYIYIYKELLPIYKVNVWNRQLDELCVQSFQKGESDTTVVTGMA